MLFFVYRFNTTNTFTLTIIWENKNQKNQMALLIRSTDTLSTSECKVIPAHCPNAFVMISSFVTLEINIQRIQTYSNSKSAIFRFWFLVFFICFIFLPFAVAVPTGFSVFLKTSLLTFVFRFDKYFCSNNKYVKFNRIKQKRNHISTRCMSGACHKTQSTWK